MRILTLCLLPLAAPALADCPAAPDISAPMDALVAEAQAAPNEMAVRPVSAAMWALWTKAPDAEAQALLDEGMDRRASFDLVGALIAFDALVEYCPDYAEGYNQRAFANFLRGEFATALPDLDRAIALSPRHVAAIAGKGLTLISMGRIGEGQDAIREAVALNPWLSERHFLTMEPGPGGDEIEL
ncbi:tetratricopeptide repeat protein [Jannaschia sp. KMU-145]|uniref:tetratricopeptide repeat protein n=1 Tax=Jannaschia halovivens TaxID=3388667 RepID=UPI00396B3AF2